MPTQTPPRPNLNTYWVVPRKFLAGEYPGNQDPVKARKKINQFLEVGVRHFVDLTESGCRHGGICTLSIKAWARKPVYRSLRICEIGVICGLVLIFGEGANNLP
jgi:hypothetical protein